MTTETSSLAPARPAPKVTRDDVAFVIENKAAVVVLDLTTSAVYPLPAGNAAFESPTMLVLVTHEEAMARVDAAPKRDLLGRVTRGINLDLYALNARGEIPTADEVAVVLAELAQLDAEILTVGGAA